MAHVEQDHFYVCLGHLKDKGFCSPIIDPAEAAAKKKKEELDREIEVIRKEYEDKLKKKKKDKKGKGADEKTEKGKDEKKEDDEDVKAEKEKDAKVGEPVSILGSCSHNVPQDQSYHRQGSHEFSREN